MLLEENFLLTLKPQKWQSLYSVIIFNYNNFNYEKTTRKFT